MLSFRPNFDIRPHFIHKEISWYSFLLEAEWTPGVLNDDRGIRGVTIFQGLYRERNRELLVLWRSASTSCTPPLPLHVNKPHFAFQLSYAHEQLLRTDYVKLNFAEYKLRISYNFHALIEALQVIFHLHAVFCTMQFPVHYFKTWKKKLVSFLSHSFTHPPFCCKWL
jgi:hypothetical protein